MEITSTFGGGAQGLLFGAEPLRAQTKGCEDAKLKESCKQFEAILWRSILEKTAGVSGLGDDGESCDKTGSYNYLVNSTIADAVSAGTNSIGAMLYRQLSSYLKNAPGTDKQNP